MSEYLHNILRACRKIGFIPLALRALFTVMIVATVSIPASAYTVVMRGGHAIEIPDNFVVTETTLTYETAPGLSVTLQVSSIDLAATEQANGETAGSLLGRVNQSPRLGSPATGPQTKARARKTLTNADLEPSRRARLESEAAYERRRVELGFPSRETTEQLRREEAARAREILAQTDAVNSEAESYWRSRATALRNQIQVVNAQINYWRGRVTDYPYSNSAVTFASFGGGFAPSLFPGFAAGNVASRPVMNVLPGAGTTIGQRSGGFTVGGAQGHSGWGFSNSFGTFGRRGFDRACRFGPCFPTYGLSYPTYQTSYQSEMAITRLAELEAERAGLLQSWRTLEDEARRAGAQPGWLRL
jgi:hypothetical protein